MLDRGSGKWLLIALLLILCGVVILLTQVVVFTPAPVRGATQPVVTQPTAVPGPQVLYQDSLRKLIRINDGTWGATCYLLVGDRIGDSALSCVR
jgi:hypothetical protein